MKSYHYELGNSRLIAPGSTKCKRAVKDDFTEKEIILTYKRANGNTEIALKMFEIELHTRAFIDLVKFMTAWAFGVFVFLWFIIK